MPRPLRSFSISKVYHVILKGINDSDIFYTNQDRFVFLEKIKLSKKEFPFSVYAYCLMSNHVHLVIGVQDKFLSKAIQSLTIRYVSYFNKQYERKGPFVQNRFKSKNVENQKYFLDVCRYVHRNPEKAGITKTSNYKWSSYSEYLGKEDIIDKKVLLHYLDNDIDNFIKYTNKVESIEELMNSADFELSNKIQDDEIIEIIIRQFKLNSAEEIISYFKNKKNKLLIVKLKNIKGITKAQLSRITRIDKKTIGKIWDNPRFLTTSLNP